MENKQIFVKPHYTLKKSSEPTRIDDVAESIYAPRSPTNHQSKKKFHEIRARSLVEVRGLPKVQTPTKLPKNTRITNTRRNELHYDMIIEASGKHISSPKHRIKKIIQDINPHKNSMSLQETSNDTTFDMKNMKIEIERLNCTIEALKEFYKEEEQELQKQIKNLQSELFIVKSEFSDMATYLAQIVGKYMDKDIPISVNEEIIEKLKEKQMKVKINLESAIHSVVSFKANDQMKIEIQKLNNPFEIGSQSSLSSTGRFQQISERYSNLETKNDKVFNFEVIALYDFYPAQPEHLEFKAGDRVQVSQKLDDDWWVGTSNNRTGKFPSNYVLLD